jgi:hypothetical protein
VQSAAIRQTAVLPLYLSEGLATIYFFSAFFEEVSICANTFAACVPPMTANSALGQAKINLGSYVFHTWHNFLHRRIPNCEFLALQNYLLH